MQFPTGRRIGPPASGPWPPDEPKVIDNIYQLCMWSPYTTESMPIYRENLFMTAPTLDMSSKRPDTPSKGNNAMLVRHVVS